MFICMLCSYSKTHMHAVQMVHMWVNRYIHMTSQGIKYKATDMQFNSISDRWKWHSSHMCNKVETTYGDKCLPQYCICTWAQKYKYAEVRWCFAHRQAYHFFTLVHCRGRMPKLGKLQSPSDNLTVVLGVSVGLVCKEQESVKVFVHWVLHQLIHEMKQCCFTYTWSCWPTMKQRVMSYMENCDSESWVHHVQPQIKQLKSCYPSLMKPANFEYCQEMKMSNWWSSETWMVSYWLVFYQCNLQ